MKFIQCPEKIFGYPGNKLSIFEKSFQNNCSKNQAAFYNEARKTNCIYGPIQELAKNAYTNSIIDVFKRMVFYERRMDL